MKQIRNSERYLIEALASQLSNHFKRVYTHRKPSSSKKFKDYIKSRLDYLPIIQPELDLVIKDFDDKLYAIEVKLLKKTENLYNMPYYLGIGQALALLRLGFDNAGLLLLVPESIPIEKMNQYGSEAWTFIRDELKLPLEYSYLKVENIETDPVFKVMKYLPKQQGFEILPINYLGFQITFKYPNPLKDNEKSRIIRQGIELFLDDRL